MDLLIVWEVLQDIFWAVAWSAFFANISVWGYQFLNNLGLLEINEWLALILSLIFWYLLGISASLYFEGLGWQVSWAQWWVVLTNILGYITFFRASWK